MRLILRSLLLACLSHFAQLSATAADVTRSETTTLTENDQNAYYWRSMPSGDSAQILTLYCRACVSINRQSDIPLVAVLRDTLGDTNPDNDQLTDVWLLSYTPQSIHQRLLAAVPFFYWRLGSGSAKVDTKNVKPLMDLTAPQHPVMSDIARDIVQWTTLDPILPLRATSRAYRTNANDHQRLHLEETISYLRNAPTGDGADELTQAELNTLIARLDLRTRLLGGLVNRKGAQRLGEEDGFEQSRIRSRNRELLRTLADRTGLIFESIDTTGTNGEYGMLWYPLDGSSAPTGTSLTSLWKVLNIKNPWTDDRLKNWHGSVFVRSLDENGSLLPESSATSSKPVPGARDVRLVPLGAYSMNYPKLPLLLIDFRDKLHVRRHEITQRTINEVTAGVIGISHFTNWYFYVGADLYDFVSGRHGSATDQNERLDCYSEFRVALALDRDLDPLLRAEMRRRLDSLSVNPLEASPEREVEAAILRHDALQVQLAPGGRFERELDRQRRAELAAFGKGPFYQARQMVLHTMSFGLYTPRVKHDPENLALLDRDRRIQSDLDFLDSATANGTRPEVAFDNRRISKSVNELSRLLPGVHSNRVNDHAEATLDRLRTLTTDEQLRAGCSLALTALKRTKTLTAPGIAVKPRVVASSSADLAEAVQ